MPVVLRHLKYPLVDDFEDVLLDEDPPDTVLLLLLK